MEDVCGTCEDTTGHVPIENDGATPWRAKHCPECTQAGRHGFTPEDAATETG